MNLAKALFQVKDIQLLFISSTVERGLQELYPHALNYPQILNLEG